MADSAIREATVTLGEGLQLHYAETGNRQGPTILLLHGYTDSWRSYRLVMPLLAHMGRVIALDLRGHGDSSAPPGVYTMSRLAEDVLAFMDRLELDAVTLVGHSMGSFIARQVVMQNPKRVNRLICVGSASRADNAVTAELREAVFQFQEWIPEEFVEDFQAGCIHRLELVPRWFFRSCVAASRRTSLAVWRAALDGLLSEDQSSSLATIQQPCLVLGGQRDAVFSAKEQEELARRLERGTLKLYQHAGHSPQWEEPGRFAEDVERFVLAAS